VHACVRCGRNESRKNTSVLTVNETNNHEQTRNIQHNLYEEQAISSQLILMMTGSSKRWIIIKLLAD
jgi:hypothetical protein